MGSKEFTVKTLLHKLRNPYGLDGAEIRKTRLFAAAVIEAAAEYIKLLEEFQDQYYKCDTSDEAKRYKELIDG